MVNRTLSNIHYITEDNVQKFVYAHVTLYVHKQTCKKTFKVSNSQHNTYIQHQQKAIEQITVQNLIY